MRVSGITLTLVLAFSLTALAQQPAGAGRGPRVQPPKLFTNSAEIDGLIAQAKSEHKDQPLITKRILSLAPYSANLEYRASVGPSAVHETEAEMFYVIQGGGTMVTGGKLTGEKRLNKENLTGEGVDGGETRVIGKGDFIIVPAGSPHWFSKIDGVLVLMSLHVPSPTPAPAAQ